jgi:hypothetical protein
MVAASPRAMVEAWIQVFNHAGARLERLAPSQSCEFLGLSAHLVGVSSRDLVVLLSPGPAGTRLLMMRDGIPRFERSLDTDAEQLVDDVCRSIAFYRRVDPVVREVRFIQTAPMPETEAIVARLGVEAEILGPSPFDSLVIEGLAVPEADT